jgi:hypothetical protein
VLKTLTLAGLTTALLFGAIPCEAAGVQNGAEMNGWFTNSLELNGASADGVTLVMPRPDLRLGTAPDTTTLSHIVAVELPKAR